MEYDGAEVDRMGLKQTGGRMTEGATEGMERARRCVPELSTDS